MPSLKEKLLNNVRTRVELRQTAEMLLETEKKLERERQERQEADRKLQEEQDRQITFIEKVVSEVLKRVPKPKGGSGDIIHLADLTSQTNGTLKIFTVPAHRKALMVIGSDFPTILMLGNGFTVSGTTLTLTTTNAPSSGSQLAFQYV